MDNSGCKRKTLTIKLKPTDKFNFYVWAHEKTWIGLDWIDWIIINRRFFMHRSVYTKNW